DVLGVVGQATDAPVHQLIALDGAHRGGDHLDILRALLGGNDNFLQSSPGCAGARRIVGNGLRSVGGGGGNSQALRRCSRTRRFDRNDRDRVVFEVFESQARAA